MIAEENLESLFEVIQKTKGKMIVVITHVDTDSIGSACAIKKIAENTRGDNEENVKIYYSGGIGSRYNETVFDVYNLKGMLHSIGDLEINGDENIILVDSPTLEDSRISVEIREKLPDPTIIIDHHSPPEKQSKNNSENFILIDSGVGAACTLVTEICQSDKFKLDFEDPEIRYLAELLYLGIVIDLKGKIIGAGKRDLEALKYLLNFFDGSEVKRLAENDLEVSFYEKLKFALEKQEIQGNILVSTVSTLSEKEKTDLPELANLFIRRKGINIVVVWGVLNVRESTSVIISTRSKGINHSLPAFIKQKFGEGSGGAKITPIKDWEGGALFAIDFGSLGPHIKWEREKVRMKFIEAIQELIISLVFDEE